ncbi:MAG TPA: ATP-binding protein [Spirochaetota bacterium]|nr:ATP-binding protein [Spirochaetota bacterium]
MENSFKKRVVRTIVFVSASFAVLALLAFVGINSWLPDYLLKKYINKSRELAQVLSRSIDGQSIDTPHERLVRRIVQLNFPEERNFVHIVIRDKSGTPMYVERGEHDEQPLSEMLDKKREGVEELSEDGPSQIVQYKERNIVYYTITTPIIQSGKKTGDVVVGFSKKYLTDRIELNRSQVTQLVFLGSISLIVVLLLSFLFIMHLFIKFKKSEETADSFKRMAYVGEISSGLAHEIRNPLNLMSINLQLMREGLEKGETERVLKKIEILEKAKDHAARILSEFLGFAKMRSKEREIFGMSQIIDEIRNLFSAEVQARQAELEIISTPDDLTIRADRAEIRQILINLLINALDAVGTREVRTVHIDIQSKRHDLLMTISDSGSGMDEFTLANIYTPFFSKKHGGTGLGLAVVKRIVEEYDGKIECQSIPGQGTTFVVTLKGILAQ